MKYLIDNGYIIEEKDRYLINTKKEEIFLEIDLDTIQFLNDTVKEPVWKTYLYLGQRWKWKGNEFVFTLEDLADHLGKKINNNSSVYRELNNYLSILEDVGLIKIASFLEEGKIPRKRLIFFNFKKPKVKREMVDENIDY